MKKTLVIDLNVIDGSIDIKNEDSLTFFEVMGLLEYAKMMFLKDWLDD
jgi:hypothetical protein